MIPADFFAGPPALAPQAVWSCKSAGALPIETALAHDPLHAAIARQLVARAQGAGTLSMGPFAQLSVVLPPGGALALALETGAIMPEIGKSTADKADKAPLWTIPGLPDTLQIQDTTLIWRFPEDISAHQWPDPVLLSRVPDHASCVSWDARAQELSFEAYNWGTRLELLTGEFSNPPAWPKLKLSALPDYLLAFTEYPAALAQTALSHWTLPPPATDTYAPDWGILVRFPSQVQGWILSGSDQDHQRLSKDSLAALESQLGLPVTKKAGALYVGDIQGKIGVAIPDTCSMYGMDGTMLGCLEPLGQNTALTTFSMPTLAPELPLPGPAVNQPIPLLLEHLRLVMRLENVALTIEKDPIYGGLLPDSSDGQLWVERGPDSIRVSGSIDGDGNGEEAVYAWDSVSQLVVRVSGPNVW